ncbi:c-type cytochrome [Geoalkalibacter sp.]|uniref:c-type cytochrome n=1 Tax=Geoalkalibacter sp. TaxID=3041440 RepID=UPI00272E9A07|nr:cytochrome c [Geoalkalibacter sp.]
MNPNSSHLSLVRQRFALHCLFLLFFLAPVSSTAQNHDHHDHHAYHQDAATGAATFKESVPEEYRIMERTPVIASQESLLRGRHLYATHCAGCHGRLGRGDGPAAATMKKPPADFLDFAHSEQYRPGEKYWLIAKGSTELGMPGFPQVSPEDVWHMVNYILALQAKVKAEGYDSPPHKH